MSTLRIDSVDEPFSDDPEMLSVVIDMLTLMDSMGLLEGEDEIRRLDEDAVGALARAAGKAGIAPRAVAQLRARKGGREGGRKRAIKDLHEALQGSPLPMYEWRSMAETLGPDRLARLVGVADASLRRYMGGKRSTPDDVAARLHFLARTVGYLGGAYNEVGIRRWFQRNRQALGGDTPEEALGRDWSPDDDRALAVLELARALTASPAT